MYKKFHNVVLHISWLTVLVVLLSSCSLDNGKTSNRNMSTICNRSFSDNPSTIFVKNALGKDENNTSIKIVSVDYSESYLAYNISDGIPYQFYVISVWIKSEDFHLQSSSGNGITIMVNDPSDYNSENVYSNMIREDTLGILGNENGWVKLSRAVKLDCLGNITFKICTGWEKNKSKGTVYIDQVKAVPIEEDSNYLLYKSTDETIRMVFKKSDVERSDINSKNISDWLDVYAKLRKSMKWLIGNKEPYEGTTDFILTENLSHYGLAGNPIYINSADIILELSKVELNPSSDSNNLLW